jgi:hypothetical protein
MERRTVQRVAPHQQRSAHPVFPVICWWLLLILLIGHELQGCGRAEWRQAAAGVQQLQLIRGQHMRHTVVEVDARSVCSTQQHTCQVMQRDLGGV